MPEGTFRLYQGEGYQNLGLSLSLLGLPEEAVFRNLAQRYGLEIIDTVPPVDEEDPFLLRSARELKLEPPIPKQRVKEFAADVAIAASEDCDPVYFYDHTGEQPKVVLVAKD